MSSTRPRPGSNASSLMQDVPGAFPVRQSIDQEGSVETTPLTLWPAVHARRAEYVRPKHIRIKIGSWNVASCKGTEKDVGGWFVQGKGVSESLSGLNINKPDQDSQGAADRPNMDDREDVATQEARYVRKQPTIPHGDPGSLPGDDDIALYVLCLQEVVDVTSVSEAVRPYTDPAIANKWKESMSQALPRGYQLVAEQQLIGLLLLVYAAPELVPEIRSVSTTSVGTGLMGYMGNKGAVTGRIVIGDTTRLVFVNCHLGAGADKTALERRNWDASQIVQRTKFEPIQDAMDLQQSTGEQLGDEDFAFWAGDLNYRLSDIPGDDVRRLLMLHTRNEYDMSTKTAAKIDNEIDTPSKAVEQKQNPGGILSSSSSVNSAQFSADSDQTPSASTAPSTLADELDPHSDPASLQTTISSLLPHDELQQQMKARKAFHDGWREGPIAFLPTYKYDIGSVGVFDSSEKKRAPSWCDRILYRTRRDKLAFEAKIREEENARKKDDEMRSSGTDQAGEDDEILYDYDPETDGDATVNDDYDEYDEYNDVDDGVVITREGFEDEIRLDYYTAHQRVLSSDHKPLNAVLTLKYDSVVPELKANIHAEVAKQLDKAENEGRPNVTVVVDQHSDTQVEQSEDTYKTFEGVWFGDVRWGQAKHRSLTIANTSRVPATFSIIERPVGPGQAPGIAPSWLNIKMNDVSISSSNKTGPSTSLEPGETTSIDLEIRIWDMNLVHQLNEDLKRLDDILVLRVDGGRDHFIPVRGKWLDTSLGHSIDKLIRIPEGGIRKLQNQRPDGSKKSAGSSRVTSPAPENQPVRFSAPRELFRLTERLEELVMRVVAEWDMTTADEPGVEAPWVERPGWPFDQKGWVEQGTERWDDAMCEVCNALDADLAIEASLPPDMPKMQRLYVLASLLLLFLEHIPDGVITESLWNQVDALLAENEKSKRKPTNEEQRTVVQEILSQSPSHSISFILITSMLERIMQEVGSTTKTSDEAPLSPSRVRIGSPFRRVAGAIGKLPQASYTEQASEAWSHIFARLLVRSPTAAGSKKGSAAQERRKVDMMLVFLRRDGG